MLTVLTDQIVSTVNIDVILRHLFELTSVLFLGIQASEIKFIKMSVIFSVSIQETGELVVLNLSPEDAEKAQWG